MKAKTYMSVDARAYAKPTVLLVDFGAPHPLPLYCVVGTDYGYLHKTNGDIRTWHSYSGARRVARNYQPL